MMKPLNITATVKVSIRTSAYYPNMYFAFDGGVGTLGPVFGMEEGQRVQIHIEELLEENIACKHGLTISEERDASNRR